MPCGGQGGWLDRGSAAGPATGAHLALGHIWSCSGQVLQYQELRAHLGTAQGTSGAGGTSGRSSGQVLQGREGGEGRLQEVTVPCPAEVLALGLGGPG